VVGALRSISVIVDLTWRTRRGYFRRNRVLRVASRARANPNPKFGASEDKYSKNQDKLT